MFLLALPPCELNEWLLAVASDSEVVDEDSSSEVVSLSLSDSSELLGIISFFTRPAGFFTRDSLHICFFPPIFGLLAAMAGLIVDNLAGVFAANFLFCLFSMHSFADVKVAAVIGTAATFGGMPL